MHTIALAGEPDGKMVTFSDILLNVLSNSPPRVNELHLPVHPYLRAD